MQGGMTSCHRAPFGEYRQLIQILNQKLGRIGHTSKELSRRTHFARTTDFPRRFGLLSMRVVDRGVTLVMRWFRANRRFSGTLALFALALQFTLAFGHIHLRDFAGVPGVTVARTLATTAD